MKKQKMNSELGKLKNVGPATLQDLRLLKINSLEQLAKSDPDELYIRLCKITTKRHDPCVWDVFAAIIHQAKTGEALSWWRWTPVRKARQSKGEFLVLEKRF